MTLIGDLRWLVLKLENIFSLNSGCKIKRQPTLDVYSSLSCCSRDQAKRKMSSNYLRPTNTIQMEECPTFLYQDSAIQMSPNSYFLLWILCNTLKYCLIKLLILNLIWGKVHSVIQEDKLISLYKCLTIPLIEVNPKQNSEHIVLKIKKVFPKNHSYINVYHTDSRYLSA